MQETNRDQRTYVHRSCGGQTTVHGSDLIYVADIFHHPDRTYCQRCDAYFAMNEFSWNDTGEILTDYYSRYASMFQGWDRFFASSATALMAGAINGILGGILGFLIGQAWGTLPALGLCFLVAILAALLGLIVSVKVQTHVCNRIIGTDDFTQLK